ncbi:MAG: HAD family phosphatase [Marivivens sp.]|jgi:2-haloacid dehalogenase|uniref:HAD-IA family hydrolase n=1 Tax=Marivivens sp. TaxID=1978374 RepID=UPI0017FB8055|nr:HAD-IA family hydrolase [Marivivens sp.]MCL7407079.1 HAD-IA family hydrolase [Marivivens geojensis]NBX08682.1 HAD family phosphatase [Marivivens sp.]NDH01637.1 HAD family phosphatase [Marivivens sp.]NVK06809.1 HAD-IA family hydrolase [Marivivens sp.]
MGIEAVVFDIGNVLIEWNPERVYDRVIGVERRKAMFAAVDLHGMNDQVDRGQNWYDAVSECAAQNPDWHDEIMMWHERWLEMASPAIDHSVRLLRALRSANVPVFALSNFGIQTFEIGEREYPFLEEFDRRYISGHMGEVKPEPEIYRMLEDDCGVEPTALLFADDRADNIAAAAARGWKTHLFTDPQGFAARLVAEGLLSEEDAK